MDSAMLLPAENAGHTSPPRMTLLLSRLQFGAKMNVLMGLMLLLRKVRISGEILLG